MKYSDLCFEIIGYDPTPRRGRCVGLARLSKPQLRLRLRRDTHDWLESGHTIVQCPPSPGALFYPITAFPGQNPEDCHG